MKIVKPSVELLHSTPNPERVIERCGRTCYQSTHKVALCTACNGSGEEPTGSQRFVEDYIQCAGTGTDISSAIAFIKMIVDNGRSASRISHDAF